MKNYIVVEKTDAAGEYLFGFIQRFNNRYSAINFCNEYKEMHPNRDFEVLETCYIPLARYVNMIGVENYAASE